MTNFKYLAYNKPVKLYIIVVDLFHLRPIADNQFYRDQYTHVWHCCTINQTQSLNFNINQNLVLTMYKNIPVPRVQVIIHKNENSMGIKKRIIMKNLQISIIAMYKVGGFLWKWGKHVTVFLCIRIFSLQRASCSKQCHEKSIIIYRSKKIIRPNYWWSLTFNMVKELNGFLSEEIKVQGREQHVLHVFVNLSCCFIV